MPDFPTKPPRPDEADLLSFVEGEPLPRDRELAVAKALEAAPALARKMERMRTDRAALRALPSVAAPPGLMDAVEAALQPLLERQVLLGIQDGEPVEDHPPVSVVQPARRSVFGNIFAERAGRYAALAAGLLLLVGGVSYWGATSLWPSNSGKSVTVNPRSARSTELADSRGPGSGPLPAATLKTDPNETPSVVAQNSGRREAPGPETEVSRPAAAEAAPLPETADSAVASADNATAAIDNERAIELAKEGRLVIRLRAPDPVVLSQPERIAERIRKAASPAWRLGDQAPAELASLLNAATPPAPVPPQTPQPGPPALAGADSKQPMPDLVGPPNPPDRGWVPSPSPAVYLVQTRLDPQSLDSLRNALAPFGDPVLEQTTDPLPLDNVSLNPAAVVWWSQPPSGWTWWASVPIVIDKAP